jgi:hypothetical protein
MTNHLRILLELFSIDCTDHSDLLETPDECESERVNIAGYAMFAMTQSQPMPTPLIQLWKTSWHPCLNGWNSFIFKKLYTASPIKVKVESAVVPRSHPLGVVH